MKRTHSESLVNPEDENDLSPEYRFDYRQAKPNRFARQERQKTVVVTLDEDVARFFKTSEAVNQALRILIQESPHAGR